MQRIMWNSDDGKYRVLARHFDGDPGPNILFWKIRYNGKKQDVRYKDLPSYVKEQIEVLKKKVMSNQVEVKNR